MEFPIFIDVGSSSVKVYSYQASTLKHLLTKSISLKDGFTPGTGLSDDTKENLFTLILSIKNKYPTSSLHIYTTALFRSMTNSVQEAFKKEFFDRVAFAFTIIDHEAENEYLEFALLGRYTGKKPVLILNIGGGSTEVVIVSGGKMIEKKNISMGVGTINTQFPNLNTEYSSVSLSEMVVELKHHIPPIISSVDTAINTGGELSYMQVAGYHLVKNTLFSDIDHPSQISLLDFSKRNEDVYSKLTLKKLEGLMPENPKWMHGARAYLAFAQAIFELYGIKTIIPSDSNLVNGIVRKDFI